MTEADKGALRDQLIPAMITLSATEDKAIRAQVAESVALIAELDFPNKWVDLIDVRFSYLYLSSLIVVFSAPCCVAFCNGLQHQYWRSPNCTFHFSAMACPRSIGRAFYRDQFRSFEIHGTIFATISTDCLPSLNSQSEPVPYIS